MTGGRKLIIMFVFPSLAGHVAQRPLNPPSSTAVVQYAPSGDLSTQTIHHDRRVSQSNQSLIAVSYEARARGVKRIMLGDQARAVCPDITLVQVCVAHKKADLTIYREAGAKVIKILARYGPTERASIDEAYVDLTAMAQSRLRDFGPDVIARARRESKVAGLEGQKEQATLSREDVRNGVLIGGQVRQDGSTNEERSGSSPSVSRTGDEGGRAENAALIIPRAGTAWIGRDACMAQPSALDNLIQSSVALSCADEPGQARASISASTTRAAAAWWDRPLQAWTRSEKEMICGAAILSEMRAAVTAELGYTCSGGLAPSKLLAKLGSAMHKPNQQTLIVQEMIPILLGPLPVARLKGLGGDFGKKVMEDLDCSTIGEVVERPLSRLEALYGESDAAWLFKLVRGVDDDSVEDRRLAKSVSCGKTFFGNNNLREMEQIHRWLRQLAGELTQRLRRDAELHARIPQLLTVSFQSMGVGGHHQNASRSAPLRLSIEQLLSVDVEETVEKGTPSAEMGGRNDVQESLADQGLSLVRRWHKETTHLSKSQHTLCLSTLYLTASNFLEIKQKSRMTSFFPKFDANSTHSAVDSGSNSTATAPPEYSFSDSKSSSPSAGAGDLSTDPLVAPCESFFKASRSTSIAKQVSSVEEIAETRKRQLDGKTAAKRGRTNMGGLDPTVIDPAVLEELPPHIRREITDGIAAATASGKRNKFSSKAAPNEKKIDTYFPKGGPHTGWPTPARPPPSSLSVKRGTLDRFLKTTK
jgi:DNA polymerase eta